MRVVVTGGTGMLGTSVCKSFRTEGHSVRALDSKDADITDADACRSSIVTFEPDLVIHCAAMTNVDACELDPDAAFMVNANGARNAAEAAKSVGATFVYVSTDFVFDGKKTVPYTESDSTNPINVYGASKLAGEQSVLAVSSESFIVRTSWLFGSAGKNFPKTILRLAKERTSIDVVSDQIGSPTYVDDLAGSILDIVNSSSFGIYHVANSGQCSWFEFAKAILDVHEINNVKVNPISSTMWQSPTKRPKYSVLRSETMNGQGMPELREWAHALHEFATENPR